MIVFLVLHYIATRDTIECANSIIKNVNYSEKKIVIIDNGSPNESFKDLKSEFDKNKEVDLLSSDINLGFAAGNNIGFKYAKETYNPDFIVMINNDTIISQTDFCDLLVSKYNQYRYAVLGPDIITADGVHQNPWIRDGMTYKQLRQFRMKQRVRIILSYMGLDNKIYNIIHRNDTRRTGRKGDLLDVPLHGAALVFSKDYILNHNGLDPRTFLYFEEEILRCHCKKEKLLMMYSSSISIYHKEDVSTKLSSNNLGEKERTEYRNRIKASREYEKLRRELRIEK